MGVYIKGMKIPPCCNDCYFYACFDNDKWCEAPANTLPNEGVLDCDEKKERPDWCPLQEMQQNGN